MSVVMFQHEFLLILAALIEVSTGEKHVQDMQLFFRFEPLVVVALIWAALGIFSGFIYAAFSSINANINQLYDGCTASTAYFKYVVKFRFGPYSKNFSLKTNWVMLDFMDENGFFITRIALPPQWLRKAQRKGTKAQPKMKITKFEFNRSRPLPQIRFVRVTHDCYTPYGEVLEVYSMEIKDLATNTITHVPMFTKITAIGPDQSGYKQNFRARQPFVAKPGQDDMYQEGISPYITVPETSIFLFFYANLCLLLSFLVPTPLKITTLGKALLNALVSSFFAVVLVVLLLLLYKSQIKTRYVSAYGTGAWSIVRVIFFTTVILIAFCIGTAAAILGTINVITEDAVQNWFQATVYAMTMLLIYAPLLYFTAVKSGFIEIKRIGEVKELDFGALASSPEDHDHGHTPRGPRKKTPSLTSTASFDKQGDEERPDKVAPTSSKVADINKIASRASGTTSAGNLLSPKASKTVSKQKH